ncbi:MAG: hypothetical protein WCZ87_10830, partial [Thiohalobacteraceae bacterium]
MPLPNPQMREASIVVTGSFNPAIFHPSWFVRMGIVGANDIDEEALEFVHKELSKFPLFNGGMLEVTTDRLQVSTRDIPSFEAVRDLAISIFTHLGHTPVTNVGINSKIEYQLENEDSWHKVGDTLAPKQIWEKSMPMPVRMLGLFVRSDVRRDNLPGYLLVRVTGTRPYGVQFDINNHLELGDGGTDLLRQLIVDHWERLQAEAVSTAETTLEGCLHEHRR